VFIFVLIYTFIVSIRKRLDTPQYVVA